MTMIRDHRFYIITMTLSYKPRIEDDLGELVGYGSPINDEDTVTVVAPSRALAELWALEYRQSSNPSIKNVVEHEINGFLQDHIG